MNTLSKFIFLCFCFLIVACSGPQKPEIKRIDNIEAVSVQDNQVTVTADVVMYNPNPIDLEITGANINVSVNDIEAAKVKEPKNRVVEANSEGVIPMEVTFPLNKIFKLDNLGSLFNMATQQKAKVAYKGDIDVTVMNMTFRVAVEKEQEVSLK